MAILDFSEATVTVSRLCRFPVKGLGSEDLVRTHIGRDGLPFDRALGLSTTDVPVAPHGEWTSYEAFHALSRRPDFAGFAASAKTMTDESLEVTITHPDGSDVIVSVNRDGAIAHEAVIGDRITEWFGTETLDVELVASGTHLWDVQSAAISVINLATVRAVEERFGHPIDPLRFRANVYIEGMAAWQEFDLVGRRATLGEAIIEFFEPIERCSATSVDPTRMTGPVNVPSMLAANHGHVFCGVYARVVEPGPCAVGDLLDAQPLDDSSAIFLRDDQTATAPRWANVVSVEDCAEDTISIWLRDPTGQMSQAAAGQHARLLLGRGFDDWRNYTISAMDGDRIRVSARIVEDGAVSPAIARLEQDDCILISGPHGDPFLSDTTGDIILLTAGIGITPALAVLRASLSDSTPRRIDWVHTERTSDRIAHLDEARSIIERLPTAQSHVFLTGADPQTGSRGTRPAVEWIVDLIGQRRDPQVLICGGLEFGRVMKSALVHAGIETASIHLDAFYTHAPFIWPPSQPDLPGPFPVTVRGSTYEWNRDSGSLLDLLTAQGLDAPSECLSGVCGTCVAKVRGIVQHLNPPQQDLGDDEVLLCSAVPQSPVAIDVAR